MAIELPKRRHDGFTFDIFKPTAVFGGFLGIVCFNEIKGGPAISFFYVCAAVVIVGSVLLAIYGPI